MILLILKPFQMLLHNPTEIPKIGNYGFSLSVGRESRIVITPRISDASRLIKTVQKNQRQCIFANEANLTYFRLILNFHLGTDIFFSFFLLTELIRRKTVKWNVSLESSIKNVDVFSITCHACMRIQTYAAKKTTNATAKYQQRSIRH